MKTVLGGAGVAEPPGRIVFATPSGVHRSCHPETFETAFGTPPPHMDDGPHLAGLTVACETLEPFAGIDLERSASAWFCRLPRVSARQSASSGHEGIGGQPVRPIRANH